MLQSSKKIALSREFALVAGIVLGLAIGLSMGKPAVEPLGDSEMVLEDVVIVADLDTASTGNALTLDEVVISAQ